LIAGHLGRLCDCTVFGSENMAVAGKTDRIGALCDFALLRHVIYNRLRFV
jgi:hypothetical protein